MTRTELKEIVGGTICAVLLFVLAFVALWALQLVGISIGTLMNKFALTKSGQFDILAI